MLPRVTCHNGYIGRCTTPSNDKYGIYRYIGNQYAIPGAPQGPIAWTMGNTFLQTVVTLWGAQNWSNNFISRRIGHMKLSLGLKKLVWSWMLQCGVRGSCNQSRREEVHTKFCAKRLAQQYMKRSFFTLSIWNRLTGFLNDHVMHFVHKKDNIPLTLTSIIAFPLYQRLDTL